MKESEKKIIIKEINKMDPNQDVLSINLEKKNIYYSDKLVIHRHIKNLNDEELVRAFLVVKLNKALSYPLENIELEKEYEAGRPKTIKPRIDIIVKDKKRENVFLFIEVKAPEAYDTDMEYIKGQLFELARLEPKKLSFLIYYTVDFRDYAIEEKFITINYNKYKDYEGWIENGSPNIKDIPKEYGIVRTPRFVKSPSKSAIVNAKDLDKKVNKKEFDRLKKELHDVLWGGGGMSYNDIFTNLLKLLLAKIYDEKETNEGEPYLFQIEYSSEGEAEPVSKTHDNIIKLYQNALKDYLDYDDELIKLNQIDTTKFSKNKIRFVVEKLSGISLTENENEGDLLGDFFESIVSLGFKQDKGQFFTHHNIVHFIIYALSVDKLVISKINNQKTLPYLVDPSCGSGTFLIEAMKIITALVLNNKKKNIHTSSNVQQFISAMFPSKVVNKWAWEFIYGLEINPDLALATKVNMVLHGDGNTNIFAKDGLLPFEKYINKTKKSALAISSRTNGHPYLKETKSKGELNEQFDILVSNPPFSIKLDKETQNTILERFIYSNYKSSENLFIERWYQLLKEEGQLGVVLPESVFDTSTNQYIRMFIFKYFHIKAIVSLPPVTFEPFTSTKTSLLFAFKKSKNEVVEWENEWRDSSNEFNKIIRKIKNLADLSDSELNTSDNIKMIVRLLKKYFNNNDLMLSSKDLLVKYEDEINEIMKNKDYWIFDEVTKKLDYEFIMAEAENVGYKRTKKRYYEKNNDLFTTINGKIDVETEGNKTILDCIRNFKENEKNCFKIKLSDISRDIFLRLDVDFHKFFKVFDKDPNVPRLKDIIETVETGKPIDRTDYSEEPSEYVHLVVRNIKEGEIDLADLVYINESKGAELRKYSLNHDDIIIALSSNVGTSSLFDINEEDVQFTLSHYLARIKCDKRKINPKILVYYLNSKAIRKYFRACETGKTQKNISKVYIRNLPILLDLDKQEEMLKEITRIEESISKIKSELKTYEMLREDITDKFLVGQ